MIRPAARPLAAILLLLAWMGVTTLTGQAGPAGQTLPQLVMQGVLRQLALASVLMAAAALLLRWPDLGFGPPRWRALPHLWLPALYLLAMGAIVASLGLPPGSALLLLAVNMLLVGFSEETMFRGFLFAGLRDRLSLWPAAIVTSILFGAIHVLNVLGTGHLAGALLQSLAATMLGFLLLGLRLATGSLWPPILVHAAWNAGLLLIGRDQPPVDPTVPIPIAAGAGLLLGLLPLGLYGGWLIRRVGRAVGPTALQGPRDPWGSPRA